MKRRSFVAIVASAFALVAGGLVLPHLKVIVARQEGLGFVDGENQMATLLAFGEALLPRDVALANAELEHMINVQTNHMPDVLAQYRAAVNLLDETALLRIGLTFRELSVAQRQDVVRALFPPISPDSRAGRVFNKIFVSPRRRQFADHALRRMNQAIYRTSMGWRIVGYQHYIGTPAADPLEYSTPPSVAL